MLIKIDTLEYPISESEFKNRFPNISFPNQIDYSDYGYAVVFQSPQPECSYKEISREIAPEFVTEKGWYEQRWEKVDITLTMTTEELESFNLSLKQKKLEQLAALRFEKETAGIEVNGMSIKTDRESQALINGAYVSTIINTDFTVDWKCGNGWITLDATQIAGIATLVAQHVQSCFTREKELTEDIELNPEIEIIW